MSRLCLPDLLRRRCSAYKTDKKHVRMELRVKDFSNLSLPSLCLRGIHKLDMRKKPRRNEENYEEKDFNFTGIPAGTWMV